MAEDSSYLSSSHSQLLPTSSPVSTSKLCSQTYKKASQLFLTRRLQESLTTLEPIISPPSKDEQYTNGDNAASSLAPIATASSNLRIKVWNLYITLLSAIVELGPEEGKSTFGQKEWKALVSKVRDGEVWETIVQTGYRGREGSVDAEVVYNLATLLLNHSPSQTLNQQRLETYLSSYGQPNLDIAAHMEMSPTGSRRRRAHGASGTDTPKDLEARVRILELFTLHVLPRNEEWDYAREFIQFSEVLDEERKEAFFQTLDGLKEEKERGTLRAAELEREREAELERQAREEERRRAEEAAAAERVQKNAHKRASSEVDYGIENHPNGTAKSRSNKSTEKSANSKATDPTGRTTFSPPPESSKNVKKTPKSPPMVRQARAFATALHKLLLALARNVTGNPMALLRTVLFMLGIVMALSRQDVRERVRRIMNTSWQKVRGTVGAGMKVSYI
ncbi:hypothetical protein Plec18167_001871 [Paecilomyces lecythidis]|uniref:Peroxin 26 n=1 Tax=Paecilomyces lecythidis TaxID=3004212 RepID=A0ABR3YCM0_9EURO